MAAAGASAISKKVLYGRHENKRLSCRLKTRKQGAFLAAGGMQAISSGRRHESKELYGGGSGGGKHGSEELFGGGRHGSKELYGGGGRQARKQGAAVACMEARGIFWRREARK